MPEANDSFDDIEDTEFPVDPAFETKDGELEAQHAAKTGVAELLDDEDETAPEEEKDI